MQNRTDFDAELIVNELQKYEYLKDKISHSTIL